MAAFSHSLVSATPATAAATTTTTKTTLSRSSSHCTIIPKFSSISRAIYYCRNPNNGITTSRSLLARTIIVCALGNNSNWTSNTYHFTPDYDESSWRIKKLLDSLVVACASLALSCSLFVADVAPASAFVSTTPRKLQSDELATVRLFQENTPSVVYITNLAAKYAFPPTFYCLAIYFVTYFCLKIWVSSVNDFMRFLGTLEV